VCKHPLQCRKSLIGTAKATDMTYERKLQQEAELWGSEAERMAQAIPPDWQYHRALPHNIIVHGERIEAMLSQIQAGMHTLELGCASGWLTLEMARRGARATGLDISEKSLTIARNYYATLEETLAGSAQYRFADLNHLDLPGNHYDLIAIKGTMHHLVNMPHVIETIHHALKSGGLLWIHDILEDEKPLTVLVASALMFILPTQLSYRAKITGLLQFGINAPSRIKASMEAEGLSPFEGAGRDHDWLALVEEQFMVERVQAAPAVSGYITAQLRLPDKWALPLLRTIRSVDDILVRIHLLKSSGMTVYARKP